jgi:hypothetical protein
VITADFALPNPNLHKIGETPTRVLGFPMLKNSGCSPLVIASVIRHCS